MEPQYVMHTMTANVNGDKLTLDAPIFNARRSRWT